MFDDEDAEYFVVVNDEEQYSIWPAHRDLPNGWRAVGAARSREDCLTHVEQVWTDMRPRSVRKAMGAVTSSPGERG
jgi:MbtH protein